MVLIRRLDHEDEPPPSPLLPLTPLTSLHWAAHAPYAQAVHQEVIQAHSWTDFYSMRKAERVQQLRRQRDAAATRTPSPVKPHSAKPRARGGAPNSRLPPRTAPAGAVRSPGSPGAHQLHTSPRGLVPIDDMLQLRPKTSATTVIDAQHPMVGSSSVDSLPRMLRPVTPERPASKSRRGSLNLQGAPLMMPLEGHSVGDALSADADGDAPLYVPPRRELYSPSMGNKLIEAVPSWWEDRRYEVQPAAERWDERHLEVADRSAVMMDALRRHSGRFSTRNVEKGMKRAHSAILHNRYVAPEIARREKPPPRSLESLAFPYRPPRERAPPAADDDGLYDYFGQADGNVGASAAGGGSMSGGVEASIPPGGSVRADGVILDASGKPVLGSDGKPMMATGRQSAAAVEAAAAEARVAELKRRQANGELTPEESAELAKLEIPPGGSIAADGTILGADGKPVLGADGKPMMAGQGLEAAANDPRIPPGGSVAADGTILGADGKPVLGADGKPMIAGQGLEAAANDPRIPPGGSVRSDGVIVDADGNPVLGEDGKPMVVADERIPPGGSVRADGVIVDADGNPVLGSDGKPMVAADARIPPGGSVRADGVIIDANGNPVVGADGKPVYARDPKVPPGGSVRADGVVLDASGNPVLGSDGRPLMAGDRKLSKKELKKLKKSERNLRPSSDTVSSDGSGPAYKPATEWNSAGPYKPEELQAMLAADGWEPAESVTWGPRVAWSDSKSLVDTLDVEKERFMNDWSRVSVGLGVERAIKTAMRGVDTPAGYGDGGTPNRGGGAEGGASSQDAVKSKSAGGRAVTIADESADGSQGSTPRAATPPTSALRKTPTGRSLLSQGSKSGRMSRDAMSTGADASAEDDARAQFLQKEIERVEEVLWETQQMYRVIFDYYATLGGDMSNISLNLWTQFLNDFNLIDRKSKFCKQSDLDTLFVTIDSLASRVQAQQLKEEEDIRKGISPLARKESKELKFGKESTIGASILARDANKTAKFDDKRQRFSRVEFVAALVNIAIRKFVDTKEMSDVPAAVSRLLNDVIKPKLRKTHQSPTEFRLKHLYSKAATEMITEYLPTLKAIFAPLVNRGTARKFKLMGIDEWRDFVRAAGLLGLDCSERDATLAFAWSRMCVTDERTEIGHVREECLPFEGFIEALCRLATLKAFPTPEELKKSKTDAASYLDALRLDDDEAYQRLLRERATEWGSEPTRPLHHSMQSLMSVVIRAIVPSSADNPNEVSPAEMKAWMAREMADDDGKGGGR